MKILYSVENSIGHIVLSHPPYNYLTKPEFENHDTLRGFLSWAELKGVVVSGQGKHFCGGADMEHLTELAKNASALKQNMEKGKQLLDIIRYATIPVVAAIRGSCLGGGLEIALACHFRFAAKSAMFGFPESKQLIMPGLGGTIFPQEIVPRRYLIELTVSGKLIGAQEALDMGIIDRCCESRDIAGEARRFCRQLTDGRPPALVRSIMASIHNARTLPLEEALRRETELFCACAKNIPDEK